MQYALIRNGKVENLVVVGDDSYHFLQAMESAWDAVVPVPEEAPVAIGWAWDGEALAAPEPAPTQEPPPEQRHITRLAFLSRFTDAEAVAIDLASIGATVEAASMRRYMSKVNAATFIDLDRADTRAGVLALEAATLLAEGRALEILDAPIAQHERANGGGV